MIHEAIHKLIDRQDLTKHEAYECVVEIMSGKSTDALIASFLTALRMKGETVPEIAGCALAMREMASKITTHAGHVIDTCGTGGDGLGTFNISTVSAIVAAAAGANVAKHGNRAISSKSGSADVLKALGVNIEASKERTERCLNEIGIAFLFAPLLHGAMKYAMPVRRELGIRTVFNILGPLTNPAGAKRQLLGVFNTSLTETLAYVLQELGTERALVVHGVGGMDEISTIGETKVTEIKNGTVTTYTLHPQTFGIPVAQLSDLAGADAAANAEIIRAILNGRKSPARDIVVLNAGAALYVAGVSDSIADGIKRAEDSIDTGNAKKKLQELIDYTQ